MLVYYLTMAEKVPVHHSVFVVIYIKYLALEPINDSLFGLTHIVHIFHSKQYIK